MTAFFARAQNVCWKVLCMMAAFQWIWFSVSFVQKVGTCLKVSSLFVDGMTTHRNTLFQRRIINFDYIDDDVEKFSPQSQVFRAYLRLRRPNFSSTDSMGYLFTELDGFLVFDEAYRNRNIRISILLSRRTHLIIVIVIKLLSPFIYSWASPLQT